MATLIKTVIVIITTIIIIMFTLVCHISGDFHVGGIRNTGHIIAVCCYKPGKTGGLYRDAKSPISGGRLPYLDVHYGLLYGRTYLLFSHFTYGTSGGDRHMLVKPLSCCWTAKRTVVYLFT